MNININYENEAFVNADYEKVIERVCQEAAIVYGLGANAEISILLCHNEYIHQLNKQYRQIDRPTDVLSFALNESEEPAVDGGLDVNVLGDLIISVERAEEQAADYGHSVRREMAFLTVHGMLHLLGYDHMEEEERAEMEAEQRFVMEKLGIPRE